jgi:hypothetical protein
MATNIKDYSTTQASNTSLNTISVAEGMLPSNLNNAIRALMKNTRDWFNDAQWIEYGDGSGAYTSAYVSGTAFTINGANVTSVYHAGRRIKVIASTPGTIYGTISSSSFSTNTTVNVTWDSGSLSSEAITNIFIGILSKTNNSLPTELISNAQVATNANIDATKLGTGVITNTEFNYLNGVSSAIQTQFDAKQATITGGASTIATDNLTVNRALSSNGSGKVVATDITATELGYLDTVSSNIQTQINNKQPLDADLTAIAALSPTDNNVIVGNGSAWVAESGSTARTSLGLGTISTQASSNVSISGGTVTGLGEPSANSDASTKSYVDQAVAGLRTRIIAEAATTGNINLSNALEAGDAIDGVTLVAGDRVLVKDQTDATANGLYLAVAGGAGAASRDPEYNTIAELSGQMIVVNQGSVNDNKIFLCTTDSDGSLGSTAITYTVITPSNSGTVTSITAGTNLSGGTITSSGTINLADASTSVKGAASFSSANFAASSGVITIKDLGVAAAEIQADAVITTKILNSNVTTAKIADLNVTEGKIAANAITLAKMAGGTDGNLITYDTSGDPAFVATGSSGQVLTSAGAGAVPTFSDLAPGGEAWVAVKTASFNAASGGGYFCNTTSTAFTATLPGSPSLGDFITFIDYAGTFDSNALTIARNSKNIQGAAADLTVSIERSGLTLVYTDATQGWLVKYK